jgi:hypothetical protein
MAHRSKLATMLGVTQQGGLQLRMHRPDCVLHEMSEIALPECNEEEAAVLGPRLIPSTLYANHQCVQQHCFASVPNRSLHWPNSKS